MTNKHWNLVYLYLVALRAIELKCAALHFEQLKEQSSTNTKLTDEPDSPANNLSLWDLHQDLANNLQILADKLTSTLNKDNCHYVISTLAFLTDELILTRYLTQIQISQFTLDRQSRSSVLQKLCAAWPKIQIVFCHHQHGGEVFFNNLDNILCHPEQHRFALEVHFFCLKLGFTGRYLQQTESLKDYQSRCFKALGSLTNQLSTAQIAAADKYEPIMGASHANTQ